MTILLADPLVQAIRVRDNGDPLVSLPFADSILVRAGLAARLDDARALLPPGIDPRVVEGHRSVASQRAVGTPIDATPEQSDGALPTGDDHAVYGPLEATVPA